MTILDGLNRLTGGVSRLRQLLVDIKAQFPDAAAEIDRELAILDAVPTAENIAALAAVLPGELLNISKGKLDPRDSPSGAI